MVRDMVSDRPRHVKPSRGAQFEIGRRHATFWGWPVWAFRAACRRCPV